MPIAIRNVRRNVGSTAGFDADAAAYIRAVQSADNAALEPAVARAINAFVLGCKADGIWTDLKACCILMGARTLSGALTALVGSNPTNVNFVSGDYNRETGLLGNGATKRLDSNRAGNADPQNDFHCAAYVTALGNEGGVYIGGGTTLAGAVNLGRISSTQLFTRCRTSTRTDTSTIATGFCGMTRIAAASYTVRLNGSNSTASVASNGATSDDLAIFARRGGAIVENLTSGRIAFYSIGTDLDLALLDTRVSDLYTAIGNAIP